MYPRVKVRQQPAANSPQEDATSLILKVIESLSLQGHGSSNIPATNLGEEYKKSYASPHARISKSHRSHSPTPSIINGSRGRNNKVVEEDNKPNIRASSVPRPRAVLSSPDNDGMIGHQNQLSREKRQTPSKKQTSSQSTVSQNKPTLKNVRPWSPANTRKTTKEAAADDDSHPKAKPSSNQAAAPRRQRVVVVVPPSREGRPRPAWIQ